MNKILVKKKKYKLLITYFKNNIQLKNNNLKKKIFNNLKLNKISLICEYKRQSPYIGKYKSINFEKIILKYELFGACALSLLSESCYFKCYLKDYIYLKKNTNLPILKKDFIYNEIELIEAYFAGYDAVLLLASLKFEKINFLKKICKYLNIFYIMEIHNLYELKKIFCLKPIFIGINCRNLKNLIIEKNNKLYKKIMNNLLIICESGINNLSDIKNAIDNNIRIFLIGEKLLEKGSILQNILKILN